MKPGWEALESLEALRRASTRFVARGSSMRVTTVDHRESVEVEVGDTRYRQHRAESDGGRGDSRGQLEFDDQMARQAPPGSGLATFRCDGLQHKNRSASYDFVLRQ